MSLPTELLGSNIGGLNPQVRELVCRALRRSHYLSKQLTGRLQDEEFQNRADLVSILVLTGDARPNGIRANGTVGFDIAGNHPYQIHQPLGRLDTKARAYLQPRLSDVPVKCSLLEHLAAKGKKLN